MMEAEQAIPKALRDLESEDKQVRTAALQNLRHGCMDGLDHAPQAVVVAVAIRMAEMSQLFRLRGENQWH